MDYSATLAAFLLVIHISYHTVDAQFGTYYNTTVGRELFYTALQCTIHNLYNNVAYNRRTAYYTPRDDPLCCLDVQTRGSCCQDTTWQPATSTITTICKCSTTTRCGITAPVIRPTVAPFTPGRGAPFCPTITRRILNSNPVTDMCGEFPGVYAIVRITTAGPIPFCNAVHAKAIVNGILKETIVTAEFCMTTIRMLKASAVIALQITPGVNTAANSIFITDFTLITGRNGVAFLDFTNVALKNRLRPTCNKMGCGLQEKIMDGKINYDDCHVTSFGSYDATTLANDGLRQVPVRISPQSCRNVLQLLGRDSLCFATKSGLPLACSGDHGAPVFCKTTTTGENVVVGVLPGTAVCGQSSNFKVIRYPTY